LTVPARSGGIAPTRRRFVITSQLLDPPVAAPRQPEPDDPEKPDVRLSGGACRECYCQAFEGNTYTCANELCGHPWASHA
jgi:hypothetical protein